jgi:hypothetical protein
MLSDGPSLRPPPSSLSCAIRASEAEALRMSALRAYHEERD